MEGQPIKTAENLIDTKPLNTIKSSAVVSGNGRNGRLSSENTDELEKFRRLLIIKSYSPSTIRTYSNEFSQFMSILKDTPASALSTDRIKDYIKYCFETLHLSEATLHSRINALKFYYERVLGKDKFF